MPSIRYLLTPLLVICTCAAGPGCRRPGSAPSPVRGGPASAAFSRHVEANDSATFRSWNGKAYRMDSDTEIAFLPDGAAHMLEYGFALSHYAGGYHLHPDGFVSVWFKDYGHAWPTMRIEQQGNSLTLRPLGNQDGFAFGNRGGATLPATDDNYWPFRLLVGREEDEALELMLKMSKEVPPPTE